MKKKITPILLSVLLLILEILPLGNALHVPNPDGNHTVLFSSYFDPMPFGNGNFAPFIVAVLTVVLLVLSILYFKFANKKFKKAVFFVACAAMLLSFCPLFYCMQCYSWLDCLIALVLFIYTMMFAEQAK